VGEDLGSDVLGDGGAELSARRLQGGGLAIPQRG
jgi:hypothetical protein